MRQTRSRSAGQAMAVAIATCMLGSAAYAQTDQEVVPVGSGVYSVAMSADARYVAISTPASLVPQDSGNFDLYVYDRNAASWALLPPAVIQAGFPTTTHEGWRPQVLGISDDGRYVGYQLTRFFGSTTNVGGLVVARYDRQSNSRDIVLEIAPTDTDTWVPMFPVMSRNGTTFAWMSRVRSSGNPFLTVSVHTIGTSTQAVGTACDASAQSGVRLERCPGFNVALSGDGGKVLFTTAPNQATGAPESLAIVDLVSGARDYYPEVKGPIFATSTVSHVVVGGWFTTGVFDVQARRLDSLIPPLGQPFDASFVSDSGAIAAGNGVELGGVGAVFDRKAGVNVPLGTDYLLALSADGTTVLTSRGYDLVFVTLDADKDGQLDWWETAYGLSPTDASDAGLDSDGDGLTNLQEFGVRSHPTALPSAQRLFAEGAAGTFFDTQVHIFNPGVSTANVVVGFLSPAGTRTSQAVTLAAKARTTLASCCLGTIEASEFSIIVESDQPVVAEREMTWDRVTGYGSHATAGAAATATEWYFAEGATIADLQLFYLFANPGHDSATVDVEYLLGSGDAVTRQYTVGPRSRLTVWVNQEGTPLDAAEISARIVSSHPIVAERASYLTRGGQTFAAGSASTGITTPGTEWRFAEGATGEFFDTFLLVGNPGQTAVDVQATYQLPAGATVVKTYAVAPKSRLTIWLDQEDPQLASTAVSTVLTSTGNIIAERAMWWPGDGSTWAEAHTEVGATTTAITWAVADAVAGSSASTSTFLLLSNPGATPGRARITLYTTTGAIAGTTEYALPPTSRTTAWLVQDFPSIAGGLFSAIVESLPGDSDPAVPISVERASYSLDFAAGSAAAATPLP